MAEGSDNNPPRHRWSQFELECLLHLENETDANDESNKMSVEPVWDTFEDTACNILKLYRTPSWVNFQHAATTTTQLYKDGVEGYRRGLEHGLTLGRDRMVKELARFLKCSNSRQPFIRRQDLLAFLAGKTPPERTRAHGASGSLDPCSRDQLRHHSSPKSTNEESPALFAFQQALSNDTAPRTPPSRSPPRPGKKHINELGAFFRDELKTHRKRKHDSNNASPQAMETGSPRASDTSKRHKRL